MVGTIVGGIPSLVLSCATLLQPWYKSSSIKPALESVQDVATFTEENTGLDIHPTFKFIFLHWAYAIDKAHMDDDWTGKQLEESFELWWASYRSSLGMILQTRIYKYHQIVNHSGKEPSIEMKEYGGAFKMSSVKALCVHEVLPRKQGLLFRRRLREGIRLMCYKDGTVPACPTTAADIAWRLLCKWKTDVEAILQSAAIADKLAESNLPGANVGPEICMISNAVTICQLGPVWAHSFLPCCSPQVIKITNRIVGEGTSKVRV